MYEEFASRVDGVVCTWERRPAVAGDALVVPDGCIDIVSDAGGRLVVAGPDTKPWRSPIEPGVHLVGVRLAAGSTRELLGLPLSELRDSRVPIEEMESVSIDDTAFAAAFAEAPQERRRDLLAASIKNRLGASDPLVSAAVNRLERQPRARVADLADDFGVSSRQLLRRFVEQVGYGPKMFLHVARLQRFAARAADADLAEIAYACGYASQSHLGDEVRELTGLTPVRFLEERRRPAA